MRIPFFTKIFRENTMKPLKKILTYGVIVASAFLCALNYQLFIFPNQFAPAGLNGICTMIQEITGFRLGYLSLIINVPLAMVVYFRVSKVLAVRSMVYVLVFSVALLVLDKVDLSAFVYSTDNGTSTIMGPLVAGIIYGTCYSVLVRTSTYSGGTDFVAAIIHKSRPEKSIFYLIFAMNMVVAMASYFVYDYKIEPVIMCILYSFTSSTVSDRMVKTGRSAVRFEIITDYPDEIANAIITKLRHSATLIPAKGMYKGKEVNLLICVVNRTQVAALSAIIRSYPHTFAAMSQVQEVMGNFKHLTHKNTYETQLLDSGEEEKI